MTIHEFLHALPVCKTAITNQAAVEALYGTALPTELASVIACMNDTIFFEGDIFLRLLSYQELLDAEPDMNTELISNKLVPIFDLGDNDYLCYDLSKNCWCKYNIVDEISFGKKDSLSAYFPE